MTNDELRKEVKLLKAFSGVNYGEIAKMVNLSVSSFSNWLTAKYNFSSEKANKLEKVINDLKQGGEDYGAYS
jgi:DNA-directed RNA polymerase specialized sigma24 family protein